ncbi:MAG: SDR family oxidoreductase [Actinobacteria bacterium]|uniref:Unannotated protein n=1 Tax=freshwater metagenome TaxID=449393 RepID=A0A6J7H8U2_9ZZZZ|nr:SDR family oxidoreductase [Actinomycetota bacterium]
MTASLPALFDLTGRTAVVTGASSGLGTTFAAALARAGASVVVTGRRADLLADVADGLRAAGAVCVPVVADVRLPADCARVVQAALDETGRVDVLVNNAGTGHGARALTEDPAAFEAVLATNLAGAHHMAQAVARAMVAAGHGGSIVNVSSALALAVGDVPQAAYTASKAGLLGLTRDLAMQWTARYGIRVNALAPGFFPSGMTAPLLGSEKGAAGVLARTPVGRVGRPEELVGPLLLLASDAGSYMTGATVAVDGGWSMH